MRTIDAKMKTIVLVLGIWLPALGMAASMVATPRPDVFIKLLAEPCTNPAVTQFLEADAVQFFFAGSSKVRGEDRALCWRYVHEHDAVFVVDEKRMAGAIPKEMFQKESSM